MDFHALVNNTAERDQARSSRGIASPARNIEALPVIPLFEVAAPTPRRERFSMVLAALALLGVAAGGAWFAYGHWTIGRYLALNDDVYAAADDATVAPKVSANIDQMLVGGHQPVKAGRFLARIDDGDFRTARDQEWAVVNSAGAAIRNIEAEIDLQHSVIDQAKTAIGFTSIDGYRDLTETGAGTIRQAQRAADSRRETVAARTKFMAVAPLRSGLLFERRRYKKPTVVDRHRVAANYFQLVPDSPSVVALMIAAIRPGLTNER